MYWSWFKSGCALGGCFLLAVLLIKPIGVSTQFVIFDGILANTFSQALVVEDKEAKSGYASSNPYLNKSGGKYAKAVANPFNYSFLFVVFMFVGGFLGRLSQKGAKIAQMPDYHQANFGGAKTTRYALAFVGGILVLWGARLAGGCTSGHMMSGMMQTSMSGYVFALSAFAAAVPVAMLVYKK
ncbi:YeeE/YedE thiosulfate transporter family protein [Dethiosulfatarculus sandiegensis]|uniref:YeeE/YedE family protein n=1 Tax=Dethiosulfatarculus sandiegensis TaxID=1429043 RepID=A0A0D2JGU0_9BACT|nr:YeeE/YedE thiosulfate transporter family protein [Dethiosulfatarculus sandiegensis]KIX14961.1 YeeE/YedE family protein [Dethiosulfatarculus sandiegensis]